MTDENLDNWVRDKGAGAHIVSKLLLSVMTIFHSSAGQWSHLAAYPHH